MLETDGYPYLVIDTDNAHRVSDGSTGYAGWQNPAAPHAFLKGKDDLFPRIPRDQWHQLIKDGQGSFLSDLVRVKGIKAKDQNGLKMCWAYGCTRALEVARAVNGLEVKELSPESVAGPCTNWRNQGGYASEAFDRLQNFGACEASMLDAPHSLHHDKWQAGWLDNAKLHQAAGWQDIDTSFDDVITCLLNRVPVAAGLPWWGHLVCFLDPVILPDGSVGVLFINSWGVDWPTPGANGLATLTEAKATPNGAAACVLTTFSEK